MILSHARTASFVVVLGSSLWATRATHGELRVGFSAVDITPSVAADTPPVWLAGYGQNRRATGVHDPLFARAVVLTDGQKKVALVAVDLVGIGRPSVVQARAQLPGFEHVLVASTHNHEGPDVIGLWGPSPFQSGVNPGYIRQAVEGIVKAVGEAERAAVPARAFYGEAVDENLLGDSRQPVVKDGVLRVLRFVHAAGGKPLGLLVQWNCHPESMGSRNTLITADFPWAAVEALKKRHGGEVAYFSGAVGGLMAPPEDHFKDPSGQQYREGDFEWTRAYGVMVADLADKALAAAKPIELWPPRIASSVVYIPLKNPTYRVASAGGLIPRVGYAWTGDPLRRGEKADPLDTAVTPTIETEVGYLRLGELHIALIPGELYPELVYGKFQEPVEPKVDFPDAELEPAAMDSLPSGPRMLFGLANDEIGYIVPRRQWDFAPPYAYGRDKPQYGEVNSVGPDAAPILMNALRELVRSTR